MEMAPLSTLNVQAKYTDWLISANIPSLHKEILAAICTVHVKNHEKRVSTFVYDPNGTMYNQNNYTNWSI